jgi:hypothetical protein
MGTAGDHEMELPAVRLWWRYFNRASQRRWVNTIILTTLACGLLWLIGRAWMFLVMFLVVGGDETTGSLVRNRDAVRYNVGGRFYTVREGWTRPAGDRIWGWPVAVQYLRMAPSVSWCPDSEDHGLLAALLAVFVAFVAAPLAWLWRTNVVRPALEAIREVRAARAGPPEAR